MEQWLRDLVSNPIYLLLVGPLSVWLGQVWATRISGREAHAQQLALSKLQGDLKLETQQREHTLEQERERWRSELSKHAFVHQVQFETEFAVYRDVWKSLVELRRATLGLRPIMDMVDIRESEEERKRKRFQRFAEAYNAFLDAVDTQRPFLDVTVYDACEALRKASHSEGISYQYGDPKNFDRYWKESQESAEAITAGVATVCDTIRSRIGLMTVVGT